MGEQDNLSAFVCDLTDGGSDALDAGQVGDPAVLNGHVKVDAHEHALAANVDVVERAEHVSGLAGWAVEPRRPQQEECSSPARSDQLAHRNRRIDHPGGEARLVRIPRHYTT